jgi:hypothetical protein
VSHVPSGTHMNISDLTNPNQVKRTRRRQAAQRPRDTIDLVLFVPLRPSPRSMDDSLP